MPKGANCQRARTAKGRELPNGRRDCLRAQLQAKRRRERNCAGSELADEDQDLALPRDPLERRQYRGADAARARGTHLPERLLE